MKIIADLHIHSRFSRACSPQLTLENIDKTCEIKGVNIVATGDFTHPEWFKEMKENLIEKESGLYVLRDNKMQRRDEALPRLKQTRFLCATEISCIYTKSGLGRGEALRPKCRRLHVCVLAPNLEAVEKINFSLEKAGCNLKSDGRPIIGMDVIALAKLCWDAHPDCMIIPAHIWTPWFAMFGSKSGFDSIEECWGDISDKIYAIETGLSSDPPMNWRIKNLDNISIISNSDAHSLPNIAREANVFEIDEKKLSYDIICDVIKTCRNPDVRRDSAGKFLYTIEFYPEEGMYHFDGHRDCSVSFNPKESKKNNNICPVCKKPLTIGVLNRVEELASPDRPQDYQDSKRVPFKKLIELDKIIAQALGIKSRSSKRVQQEYKNLINNFKNEFEILLHATKDDLTKATLPQIVEGILRAREGRVHITPGFDGEYGKIKIFNEDERVDFQKKLF